MATLSSVLTTITTIISQLETFIKLVEDIPQDYNSIGTPFLSVDNPQIGDSRYRDALNNLIETKRLLIQARVIVSSLADDDVTGYEPLNTKLQETNTAISLSVSRFHTNVVGLEYDKNIVLKGLDKYSTDFDNWEYLLGINSTSQLNDLMLGRETSRGVSFTSLGLTVNDLNDVLQRFLSIYSGFYKEAQRFETKIRNVRRDVSNLAEKAKQEETANTTPVDTGTAATTTNSTKSTNTATTNSTSTPSTTNSNASDTAKVDILSDLQDNLFDVPGEAWGIKFSYTVLTGTVRQTVTGNVTRDLTNKLEKEVKKIKASDLTAEKKEAGEQELRDKLAEDINSAVEEALSTTDQASEIVNQANAWYMQMLPAMRSNVGLQGATDVPGAQPGLNFQFKTNVVKHRIPGFQPVYQSLGVDSLQCTLVGCFTGADGPQVGTAGTAANLRNFRGGYNPDIDFLNPYGGQTFNDLVSKFDSFQSYQSFLHNIVVPNREVTIEINFGRYGQSTALGDEGFLRSVNGNPSFKALVKALNVFYVRYDRTWYIMEIEITDAGLVSGDCLNLTNIINDAVDSEATAAAAAVEEIGPGTLSECDKSILDSIKSGAFKEYKRQIGDTRQTSTQKIWVDTNSGFAFLGVKTSRKQKGGGRSAPRINNYQINNILTREESFRRVAAEFQAQNFGDRVGGLSERVNRRDSILAGMIKAWAKPVPYVAQNTSFRNTITTIEGGFFSNAVNIHYYSKTGTLEIEYPNSPTSSITTTSITEAADALVDRNKVQLKDTDLLDTLTTYFDLLKEDKHFGIGRLSSDDYLAQNYCNFKNL